MGCYFLWGVEMIVYLDMDQVLTDFNKAVCEKFKLSYPPQIYNFFESIRPQVNDICTFDFWENLEWMPDGKLILGEVCKFFNFYTNHNIYILTSPMPNVESATGKWQWIKKHIPDFYKQTILTQAPKKLLAKPNTILIDDCTKNVDEFRQAGGQTILVPRSWNSLHLLADKSVEIVKQQLAEVKC